MTRKLLSFIFLILITTAASDAATSTAPPDTTFVDIFEKTKDSIVSITVTSNSMLNLGLATARGVGSILTADGYILSAAHLFRGSITAIEVNIGKNVFKAQLIGKDDKADTALIKIDATTNLKPMILGDSDALKIGEYVAAIGDPFGLTLSITHGIISGKKRNIGQYIDEFIQHDAPINPGNSGGPLVNTSGEVVGMNTIVVQGNNTGFAVPINLIKKIIAQLKQDGKVTRSWLGAELQDAQRLTDKKIQELGLPQLISKDKNAVIVVKVLPRSPAQKAGLKIGDVIRGYNDKKVRDSIEFSREISFQKVNNIVTLVIERNGKLLTVDVKLAQYPD